MITIGRHMRVVLAVVAVAVAAGCASDEQSAGSASSPGSDTAADSAASGAPPEPVVTPVVGSVMFDPTPFAGSDGDTHLVYEVTLTNFTPTDATVSSVRVLDAAGDASLESLDASAVAARLKPVGRPVSVTPGAPEGYSNILGGGQVGTLFLHVTLPGGATPPAELIHEVAVRVTGPSGEQTITERIAPTEVDDRTVPVLGAPLRGERYIAADACCDAVRHTRAMLPVNGAPELAQRYAVDWEQADAQGRIYVGDRRDPSSYQIFGDDALAVADGTVVASRNDLPEQTPGTYPEGIDIADADGNNLVLDIGDGFYVNYAHMQPGSVRFAPGDRIRQGDVIGKVGNTGNSVAPHLHVHVMNGPSFLASQGVPSVTHRFTITGRVASTAAFDAAEGEGVPLVMAPGAPTGERTDEMILDQNVVTFAAG
ncbi:M23 family metallopeptidase [Gordonia insulae]|uniref:M23ase beta-sheet core domain-containing protein n=1 Tax=Gordonia insulae TaxID=2420509 RepID=A0A3G8JHB3_9ACTN|nr:M23 family metallopeptidase [Gordonia insulae]AZG44384.1 hypothetical protein D7316_00968 [Gordonia insulae]